MRTVSRKRAAVNRERRRVVIEQLAAFPICQRCHARPADDVHEILSRGRGGSILIAANLASLCRPCHDWVTTNPAQATAEGWLRSSVKHLFVSSDGWYCNECGLPAGNALRHLRDGAA